MSSRRHVTNLRWGNLSLCVMALLALVAAPAAAADRFWVKASGTGNWSDTANWSTTSGGTGGASVPGASDRAIFNNARSGNCTIDATVNIAGMLVGQDTTTKYTGTITQGSGIAITIGATDYYQAGGAFVGSDAAITINGDFTLESDSTGNGSFTSTSGTLTIAGTSATCPMPGADGTDFVHNNGTVALTASADTTFSGGSFYNLRKTTGAAATLYMDGDLTVAGALTFTGVSGGLLTVRSVTAGVAWNLTLANDSPVELDWIDLRDCNATSTVVFTNTENTSNNTGATIITSANARYWIASSAGNWNSTANWSATSGGTGGASVPGSGNYAIFNGGGGTLNGNCTINAAVNVAGIKIAGYTGTISQGANTMTLGGAGWRQSSGTFTGGSSTITFTQSVHNQFVQTGGTFTATSGTMAVGGTFLRSGGTFTHNSGTVSITAAGTGIQWVQGSTTFNNLTSTCTTARTVQFAAGTTQTVGGTLTMNGASGQLLKLRSSTAGSTWSIAPTTRSVSYVDVQDSINTVSPAISPSNSTNSGNNTLWFPTAPTITTRQTIDNDNDGMIDRIRLVLSAAHNSSFGGLTVAVTGYTVTGYSAGASDEVFVALTESGSGDTGATPAVRVTANSSLAESTGASLLATEGSATNATDAAAPVLRSATFADGDSNGVDAGDTIALTFSESVTDAAGGLVVGDFTLPVANDTLSGFTLSGSGTTRTLTLSGTPALTPGGTYSGASLGDGKPSGLRLTTGTHVQDGVGYTGNTTPAAIDLGPTATSLAIAWASGGTAAKTWALSTLAYGDSKNTSTDGLSLTVRNIGDTSQRLRVSTANSSPSAWTPGAADAGSNSFFVKADVAPATPSSAASYSVTVGTSASTLVSLLRSGSESPCVLFFKAPTGLTVGGGIAQTITVTITADIPP